jgi:catechol 2,3-dioxygenase-like lactoylglutathione lyase family enzyme
MKFHYAVAVNNLEESEAFYKKLGFEKTGEWTHPEKELKGINLLRENCGLELVYHPKNSELIRSANPFISHLGLEVENVPDLIDELGESIEIVVPLSQGITVRNYAFIKDPSGNYIELFDL